MEQIGIKQLHKNIEFADYKMIRGEMVLSDYDCQISTQEFISLVNEVQLPSNVRHYDFLGMIVNQIVGEYGKFKDAIIDTRDIFHRTNTYETKLHKVKEFAHKKFDLELQKKKLLEAGVTRTNSLNQRKRRKNLRVGAKESTTY
jgi:replication initiation and membrane attachment protein DnaB